MNLEKETQQFFKESYLEYLCTFLKEDKKYLLMRENICLAENEVLEFPTENNKKILKQKKFNIAEYLHISIYKMGFYEGIDYSQSISKEF